MSKRISVLFYQLDSLSKNAFDELKFLFEGFSYNENNGFGFLDVKCNYNYLNASLVTKSPSVVVDYDSTTGELVRKTIFLYSNIQFAIDLEYKHVEVFASQKDSSKLISVLANNIFKNQSFKQISFFPYKVLPKLKGEIKDIEVTKINVDNFAYENKAKGSFHIRNAQQDYIYALCKIYEDEVKRMSLVLDTEEFGKIDLSFSINGQLSLKADDPQDALFFLKSIILK